MRGALLLIIFISVFLKPAFAMERPEAVRLFSQSIEAYKNGQFDESAKLGERVLAGGFMSPAVYYNLGNAYVKDHQLGRAILNYRRAERLTPREADLRVNLDLARGQVEGVSGGSLGRGIPRVLLLERMTTGEIRWVSLFFFVAATGFCLLGLYLGIRQRRLIGWTFFLALLWVFFLTAWTVRTIYEAGLAVAVSTAEAKFEPLKGATTYFRIPEGNEVHVLREQDGWYKIERADGKTGWVPSLAIEKI
jgi:tetratricopeptide (TPR) repeat protein